MVPRYDTCNFPICDFVNIWFAIYQLCHHLILQLFDVVIQGFATFFFFFYVGCDFEILRWFWFLHFILFSRCCATYFFFMNCHFASVSVKAIAIV